MPKKECWDLESVTEAEMVLKFPEVTYQIYVKMKTQYQAKCC